MDCAVQTGAGCSPERIGESWARSARGGLVAIDREGDDARVLPLDEPVHEVERLGRGLPPEKTDADPHHRMSVGFSLSQTGIDRLHEARQVIRPRGPVRWVHDDIGGPDARGPLALGESIRRSGQLLPRSHHSAGQVEESEERPQVSEPTRMRSLWRQRLAGLSRHLGQVGHLEASLEMHVDLRLRHTADGGFAGLAGSRHRARL